MRASGLIIWDLDGTLVDSRADIVAAAHAARAAVGLGPMADERIATFVGDGVAKLIERLVADAKHSDAKFMQSCQTAFECAYAAGCCAATTCYPGIRETLADLTAAGWTHAVATNKADAFVAPILAYCGIAPQIAAVRGGDGPRKPDPWQLNDLRRELRVERAWMVGDHHTDIAAAAAASIPSLFCSWGLGHANGLLPTATAAHSRDIPAIVGAP